MFVVLLVSVQFFDLMTAFYFSCSFFFLFFFSFFFFLLPSANVANYPFCTIEPNVARVIVPDPLLDRLAEVVNAAKITPVSIVRCEV